VPPIDENDLYQYFEIYGQYQEAEDPRLVDALDKKLSQYKDRFHKHSQEVLALLKEGENDFIDRHRAAFQDLVFDLEIHAKSLEEIRQTHTYDTQRRMWVPKGK
jgi:dsDNA-specific endonuclease/ATPase MutS2